MCVCVSIGWGIGGRGLRVAGRDVFLAFVRCDHCALQQAMKVMKRQTPACTKQSML